MYVHVMAVPGQSYWWHHSTTIPMPSTHQREFERWNNALGAFDIMNYQWIECTSCEFFALAVGVRIPVREVINSDRVCFTLIVTA